MGGLCFEKQGKADKVLLRERYYVRVWLCDGIARQSEDMRRNGACGKSTDRSAGSTGCCVWWVDAAQAASVGLRLSLSGRSLRREELAWEKKPLGAGKTDGRSSRTAQSPVWEEKSPSRSTGGVWKSELERASQAQSLEWKLKAGSNS